MLDTELLRAFKILGVNGVDKERKLKMIDWYKKPKEEKIKVYNIISANTV